MTAMHKHIDTEERWFVPTMPGEMLDHFAFKAKARSSFGHWRLIGAGGERLRELGWAATEVRDE